MAGALTAAIAAAFSGGAAAATDPYFEYTTLLLPGSGTNGAQNNTFLDGSTNNFTITRNGNTTQGTFSPFSQTGWGNYFDGTGDYLTVASNTALTYGTGNFTIEGWHYLTASASSTKYLFDQRVSGNGFFPALYISSGQYVVYINGAVPIQAGTVAANSWVHWALVKNASTTSLYINGTSVGSFTDNNNYSTTAQFRIGSEYTASGLYDWSGYISNVRVVKGTAVYTSNFTPPTSPLTATQSAGTNISAITGTQTSLLTCQSNRFIDNSTNNFTITRNGDTRVVAFSPFNPSASWSAATYGGSGYFDGSGDYLTTPNVAALQLSNSVAWTIELWFYANAMSGQQHIFHGYNTASPYQGWGIALGANTQPATTLLFWDGTTWRNIASGLSPGQWYHVAVAYDGSGTTGRLYLNGNQQGSSFAPASTINNTSTAIGIGGQYDGSLVFNGYVNGTRIVKGTAVYTGSTYSVPTAPLTAITNTSLLLNFTNAGVYDATSKNDLETVADAQISNTTAKWGSTSIKFDGTGDWLLTRVTDLYNFGTGDFTVECWAYTAGNVAYTIIFDSTAGGGAGGAGWFLEWSNTRGLVFFPTGYTRAYSITLNQWYHIAVTRSGTNLRMFVNGTQQGATETNSSNIISSQSLASIAATNDAPHSSAFNGYLQDFRITKGYARYTANFTAPTAAFPTL